MKESTRKSFSKSRLPEHEKELWRRIDALCGQVIVLHRALKKIHGKVYSPFARKVAGEALAKYKKMNETERKRAKGKEGT